MDDGYLGEIRMFAGTFAPRGWAMCAGQVLAISDNNALFSILGKIYGGDGKFTFRLPDFRGRIPIGVGYGPGLSDRQLGQKGGAKTSFLGLDNLPTHTHTVKASGTEGNAQGPTAAIMALSYGQMQQGGNTYTGQNLNFSKATSNIVEMSSKTVSNEGESTQHYNMQPFLGINYIICLQGRYPSRN